MTSKKGEQYQMYTNALRSIIRQQLKSFLFEATTAFLIVLMCEFVLRLAMFATDAIPAIRNPHLYGSWQDEDLFWELNTVWNGKSQIQTRQHALLGWETSPEVYQVKHSSHSRPDTLLVFGDSFLARLNQKHSVAEMLSQKPGIPYTTIINCAVPGFGLDQIVLNMELKARQYPTADVLVGVLNSDLDRSCLSFRELSKPYFYYNEQQKWDLIDPAAYRPSLLGMFLSVKYCYLFDLLYTSLFYDPKQGCEDVDYKQNLNAMLLNRAESYLHQNHKRYKFVFFYAKDDLFTENKTWSYPFLHRFASHEKGECIQLDESAFPESGQKISGLFQADGHFNNTGVKRAADYIAPFLLQN